jgi:hypothetical protein
MVSNSRDLHWKYDWVWEALWFFIYTGFVVSIIVILQPNKNSDLLCEIEELLDETLTEMPTQDDIHLDDTDGEEEEKADIFNSHEAEGIEMHEFGSNQSNTVESESSSARGEMTMAEFAQMKRRERLDKKQ